MKICFVWPWNSDIQCESLEFYIALKKKKNIILVDTFDEADYIFFMMDIRNCMNMPWYNVNEMNQTVLQQIINHKNYEKEIIIDYNDWTDTRNVPDEIFPLVKKYFKRSVVNKNSMSLIPYSREVIPLSYAIRNDYIEFDSLHQTNSEYIYDVCCLFNICGDTSTIRGILPHIVNNYHGSKYVGLAENSNYNDRYHSINENYYNKLKTSKIIVTGNPPNWEGDFRLWEALLVGNLVLCDKMVLPHILKYPLIHKKHIVFYDHPSEVIELINYYIEHEDERNQIGKEGRDYVLKYHTFDNRLDEILEDIS
jgi:hypothetical protein